MKQLLNKIFLRRLAYKKTFFVLIAGLASCNPQQRFYTVSDFKQVPKIDAHFHYLTKDPAYILFARSLHFKLVTPIWEGDEVPIDVQFDMASSIRKGFSSDYAFCAAFPTDSINFPGFAEKTIHYISESIKAGAAGIKIWKNIGMVIKYPDGKYIMIDDPVFEPVFRFLEEENIPVVAHLGEPRDCWLPFDEMTDKGDLSYYQNHPQYYMYLHPEVPCYEEQIKARDKVLEKYPRLDFTGAHLGSLEWSTDELTKRLDAYPNFKADLAARMGHLKNQSVVNREKVRNFLIKYQDRIVYGTDNEVHDFQGVNTELTCEHLRQGWESDWLYLATDSTVNQVKGLRLPKKVIDKIYFKNALRYFKASF